MSKPLFQDIVPPEKRSIKKIPVPTRPESAQRMVREESRPQVQKRKKSRRFVPWFLTIVALAVLGGIVFVLLPRVSVAHIRLVPQGRVANVDASFSATAEGGSLPFQVVVYEKDGKLAVPAGSEETVNVKASGTIRVYNNFSTTPQKLVGNTRFETPQGKIFRISDGITIPGKVGDTPGSVDVTVVADAVGPAYNMPLTDFTLPGLKGDPKYTKLFARSVTPMSGGFSGTRKKVDETQAASARTEIEKELKETLIKLMQQNTPDAFVFLPGAYFISFEKLPDVNQGESVLVSERASFHGIIFKRSDIARIISEKATGIITTNGDVVGTDNLEFTPRAASTTKPWEAATLPFSLKGSTTLITAIDTSRLLSEIAGKPRKSLSAIVSAYPGIAKVEVTIRPFWKQNFPTSQSDIVVEIAPSPVSP